MLSSFWSWGSAPQKRQDDVGDEDTVWSTENDDELADRLLTQFPAYGTNAPNLDNWIAPSDNYDGDDSLIPMSPKRQVASNISDSKSSWDPNEESLWKGSSLSGDIPREKSTAEPTPRPLSEGNQEHWMPDQLCKQCYDCDSQFTVFRRRHHCRLCGQVFCSSCSAYFVELDEAKTSRACRECFEQYQKMDDSSTDKSKIVADGQQHLPQHLKSRGSV